MEWLLPALNVISTLPFWAIFVVVCIGFVSTWFLIKSAKANRTSAIEDQRIVIDTLFEQNKALRETVVMQSEQIKQLQERIDAADKRNEECENRWRELSKKVHFLELNNTNTK